MIHLYTQNTGETQNVTAPFSKSDNDSRIIKSSEMAVQVASGSNFLSLYSNQNDIAKDAESGALQFDVRNNLDYMTVMSNTMSSEDFNKMVEDGAKPGDMDEAESVNTLDRIKAKMAESGMVVRGYNDDLPMDVIEEITGSKGAAEALKKEFEERDLSLNKDIADTIRDVYKKADEITEITDGMCDYILRNAIEPTIENLYRVRFCAAEVPFKEGGYFSDEYGHIVKDGDGDFGESKYFEEKIHEIASDLKIEDSEEEKELLEEGKWLVKSRILCNERNLSILHELRNVNLPLSDEEKAAVVANAVERGVGASEAEYTKSENLLKKAVWAKEVVDNATDSDVQALINEEKELNIKNLSLVAGSNVRTLNEGVEDPRLITGKRILAEARLQMSVEANYMMIKRGFSIEITALEETVNVLKALEDKVNREFFGNDPIKAADSAALWKESRQVIAEMPYLPVKAVGDITKNSNIFSLRLTYEVGVGLKEQFDKAQKTYEAVGTEVRSDLGDDIKKAFSNIDDILKEQGMEINENNKKAVRILGYSEMEITKENIIDISEKETMLNRVINKMNPENTLKLIREGINPLEIGMEELEAKLDEMGRDSISVAGNYASFICKLDRAGEISEEERNSFIGIYRLLDKIDKSDGKALGDLVKGEADINFKNLLTAIRTGKSRGLNIKLDENVGGIISESGYDFDISEQIASAFTTILTSEDGQEEYLKREYEAYRESLVKDEKNAAAELEFLNEKVTPENIKAMAEILGNDKDYNPWKKMDELADRLEDNSFREAMQEIAESFEDEATLEKAYDKVLKEAGDAIGRIAESGIGEYLDIKAMQQTFKQIGLVSKMTREENYEVPLMLEDETLNIRVKILKKAEKEGKVFTSFETEEFGSILAQFTVNDGVLSALVAGESNIGLERLKEKSNFEESFKNAGFEEVTFNYIQTDIINVDYFRQHFDKAESDQMTTKQLYNIAKTFIQTVKKAGSNL
ncbi:MAG: DUF6240 domain-containing protein [Lachnospiraceae bacterium]|nr:DUF6240 domain-containing protein [Lachnospiraceae bacterium]